MNFEAEAIYKLREQYANETFPESCQSCGDKAAEESFYCSVACGRQFSLKKMTSKSARSAPQATIAPTGPPAPVELAAPSTFTLNETHSSATRLQDNFVLSNGKQKLTFEKLIDDMNGKGISSLQSPCTWSTDHEPPHSTRFHGTVESGKLVGLRPYISTSDLNTSDFCNSSNSDNSMSLEARRTSVISLSEGPSESIVDCEGSTTAISSHEYLFKGASVDVFPSVHGTVSKGMDLKLTLTKILKKASGNLFTRFTKSRKLPKTSRIPGLSGDTVFISQNADSRLPNRADQLKSLFDEVYTCLHPKTRDTCRDTGETRSNPHFPRDISHLGLSQCYMESSHFSKDGEEDPGWDEFVPAPAGERSWWLN